MNGIRTSAAIVCLTLAASLAAGAPPAKAPPKPMNEQDVRQAIERLTAAGSGGERAKELSALAAGLAKDPARAASAVQSLRGQKHPLNDTFAADLLYRLALKRGSLAGPLPELAANLLDHPDAFVAALAEWALATRVAHDNDGAKVAWPRPDAPAWFTAWTACVERRKVELDHARQAIAWDLHLDSSGLLGSAGKILARARGALGEIADARLAGELAGRELADLERLREELAQALRSRGDDDASARRIWLAMRATARRIVLARPELDFAELLHIRRYPAHSHRNITGSQYPWVHKPGGDIYRQDLRGDAPPRPVLAGRLGPGHVHGMDLDYDAAGAVFAWARQDDWPPPADPVSGDHAFELRGRQSPTHIYEIRLDGSAPRQITNDPYWSDLEPTCLADGRVAFASDRSGRSSECGKFSADHTVINLYACRRDGSGLARLSDNKDIDRYPHALDDGSIVYTRWDYQERHFLEIHSLWTIRPDGTQSEALFKQHLGRPFGLRDARPIPGCRKLVAVATGHHTFAYGPVVVVDPDCGVNAESGIRIVTPGVKPQEGPQGGTSVDGGGPPDRGGVYQTPWALSQSVFLASYSPTPQPTPSAGGANSNSFAIYVIDVHGNKELLVRDALLSCSFPIPLRRRPRPPVLPAVEPIAHRPGESPEAATAVCYVSDLYDGVSDLEPGRARYIRISQRVGWPLDKQIGAMRWIPGNAWENRFGFWSWAPVRVIGTVAVEKDGSACFRVPADTAVYFQALDENHMELWRMRSHVTLQAGETRGCRGCHQTQDSAPRRMAVATPLALAKGPVTPTAPPWGGDRLLGYEWLVQPVLDRQCVRCHAGREPKAGLDFSADRADDGFVQSFRTMFGLARGATKPDAKKALVACSNRFSGGSVSKLTEFGSHRSRLIKALLGEAHRKRVRLSEAEWQALVTWVDANAPYYDTFFNRRPPGGGPPVRDVRVNLPAALDTARSVTATLPSESR